MANLPPELATLPPPFLIEELAYEARLTLFKQRLVEIFTEAGIAYDVAMLETDPAVVLLEVSTYIDALLRQRINEALRANFLAFAAGSDLDHLAQWYDVGRLTGETDEALRARITLAIRGRSTGGTEPRYQFAAMSADPRVAAASVYTLPKDPTVHVAIFSTENNGVADAGLLAIVDAAMQDPAVRMVNDRIVVAAASRVQTPITVNAWFLPQVSVPDVILGMQAALTAAWAAEIGMGRDVTRSWLIARLSIAGVQKIEITSPAADVVVPFNQAAALGAITITDMGRAF